MEWHIADCGASVEQRVQNEVRLPAGLVKMGLSSRDHE